MEPYPIKEAFTQMTNIQVGLSDVQNTIAATNDSLVQSILARHVAGPENQLIGLNLHAQRKYNVYSEFLRLAKKYFSLQNWPTVMRFGYSWNKITNQITVQHCL